jgi:hypothetical protein
MAELSVERIVQGVIVVMALVLFVGIFSGLARAELLPEQKDVIVQNEVLVANTAKDAAAAEELSAKLATPQGLMDEFLQWIGLKDTPQEAAVKSGADVVAERQAIVTGQNYDFLTQAELIDVPDKTHEEPTYTWNPACTTETYDETNNATGLNTTLTRDVGCDEVTGTNTVTDTTRQVIVTTTQTYPIDASKEWCYQTDTDIICKDLLHGDPYIPSVRYGLMWRQVIRTPTEDGSIIWTQEGDQDPLSVVQPITSRQEQVVTQ